MDEWQKVFAETIDRANTLRRARSAGSIGIPNCMTRPLALADLGLIDEYEFLVQLVLAPASGAGILPLALAPALDGTGGVRSGGAHGTQRRQPGPRSLTLTRLAAEESEGPGSLEGCMRNYLAGLQQRNGTAYLEVVAITLARARFKSLDDLA